MTTTGRRRRKMMMRRKMKKKKRRRRTRRRTKGNAKEKERAWERRTAGKQGEESTSPKKIPKKRKRKIKCASLNTPHILREPVKKPTPSNLFCSEDKKQGGGCCGGKSKNEVDDGDKPFSKRNPMTRRATRGANTGASKSGRSSKRDECVDRELAAYCLRPYLPTHLITRTTHVND